MPSQDISSAQDTTRDYSIAVGVLLLLIVYGSLYPLTWNFAKPQDFIYLGPVGVVDLLENVVLFLPLGWLLAWRYHGKPNHWIIFGIWFVIALVVASVLQWLQKYLPRTPALADIVFNMAGHALGWWGGVLSLQGMRRLLQRHQGLRGADRFAVLLICVWLVAELFPLVPTVDVSSLANNFKSLWLADAWEPRRMLLHVGMTVIGLEALAHLLRSVDAAHRVGMMAVFATLGMLAGKFVVIDQSPGLAVVLGIGGGWLLWTILDSLRERRRLALICTLATGSYLLHALWPLEWRDPEPMRWLPFASSLANSIESVVTSVAFEALCFGAIIWSAVRRGALLGGMTLCTAILAFGAEWLQRYLPGRTAEITSVLLALTMGWLVAALGRRRGY